jgi:hypothetical protein
MYSHPSFDGFVPSGQMGFPLKKLLQIGGDFLTAWRLGRLNRAWAGAGATPVFVAASRHDTFLARRVSLVGRYRTCPSSFVANRNAIRVHVSLNTKE